MCENYGAAYLGFEYQRSFKDRQIAQALFGSSALSFAGSQVTDRTPMHCLQIILDCQPILEEAYFLIRALKTSL